MIKEARKPSGDPAQEKLREQKAQWNKAVSVFIADLIHLKKMMNGWPSKFHQERSYIKDPIPADAPTIIGSLAEDYQDLTQKATNITKEQLNYSKSRRKKQPKQMNLPLGTPTAPPAPEAPQPDLSQQLSLPLSASTDFDYSLISEASNPISRFFTRLLTPTAGTSEAARVRQYRISLLNSCIVTFRDLNKLQVEIVKSSPESIESANKLLRKAWNDWMLLYRGYSYYKNNMPAKIDNAGGDIVGKKEMPNNKKIEEPQEFADAFKDNYDGEQKFSPQELGDTKVEPVTENATSISDIKKQQEMIREEIKKQKETDKAQKEKDKLQKLKEKLINKHPGYGSLINSPPININTTPTPSLEAVAQKFLKKWLGKTRHQIFTNNSSPFRLDIFKTAKMIRQTIDEIMDSLEKDMNIAELDPLIMKVNRQMTTMRGLMRALHLAGSNKTK